jgi:DNA-binding winged helix-turn-helix (wHTH) protein
MALSDAALDVIPATDFRSKSEREVAMSMIVSSHAIGRGPSRPAQKLLEQATLPREVLSFGEFELQPQARLLARDSVPVDLGGRAFDILCVLVEHAGRVVTKRDLLAKIWKDVAVEEGSLRFHVSELRRALGDEGTSARYVKTLVGQGYCFVAPVARSSGGQINVAGSQDIQSSNGVPPRLERMVGRDAAVEMLPRV